MKKLILFTFLFITGFLFSCTDENDKPHGTVVFEANYHIINSITNVDVFIDGRHVGRLYGPTDSVPDCELNYGLRTELESGHYNYKIEISSENTTGCAEDIWGELNITEGSCKTVFIDYMKVFTN